MARWHAHTAGSPSEIAWEPGGGPAYALVVRAPSTSALEDLLDALRANIEVTLRATVVLSIPFEHRRLAYERGLVDRNATSPYGRESARSRLT